MNFLFLLLYACLLLRSKLASVLERLVHPVELSHLILINHNLALLIQCGSLIRDGDRARCLGNLLSRDTHVVTGNDQDRDLRPNTRWQVSLLNESLIKLIIFGHHLWNQLAHGMVIVVDVWLEEFGEHIWLLGWCTGSSHAVAVLVGGAVRIDLLSFRIACDCAVAMLNLEEGKALFSLKRLGEVFDEWLKSAVETDVEEGGEDEQENHHNEWTDCSDIIQASGEETEQADFGDVEANEEVLQSTWVDGTASVDTSVVDIKEVVAIREVEEEDTDCGEDEHEWCNASVGGGYGVLARDIQRGRGCTYQ